MLYFTVLTTCILFPGFTGVLLVVIICIIYVFATQFSRRLIFNAFWLSHKLIVIMYVLTILHGASMVVQKPMFFIYFIGPALLFAVDKMVSLSRKGIEIAIVRAENLASGTCSIDYNFRKQSQKCLLYCLLLAYVCGG